MPFCNRNLYDLKPGELYIINGLDWSWAYTVFREIPNHEGYVASFSGDIWSCWKFKGAGYGRPGKRVMSESWKKLKGYPRKEDGRLRYTIRRNNGTYRRVYLTAAGKPLHRRCRDFAVSVAKRNEPEVTTL